MSQNRMAGAENPVKKYWNFFESFQKKAVDDPAWPTGRAGLEALRKIRAVLEPNWLMSQVSNHPLRHKLAISSEPNYVWVCHFARKLEQLQKIPGSEPVIARLGSAQEYSNAWAELDFALRVHLSGFRCKFVSRSSKPTPDIMCEIDHRTVAIEVTSLNTSSEDMIAANVIGFLLMAPSQRDCTSGGFLSRVPSSAEIEDITRAANKAVDEAAKDNRVVRTNIPGLLTYNVAPNGINPPSDWISHFEMANKTPLPKKDKLVQRIDEKARQFGLEHPSVLIVNDKFAFSEEIQQLSENRDIRIKVGTYPSLAGVVWIHPYTSYQTVPRKNEEKYGIVNLEYPLQDGEAERCIIWKNPFGDHPEVIESIVQCMNDAQGNLASMFL